MPITLHPDKEFKVNGFRTIALFVLTSLVSPLSHAQVLRQDMWVPNGKVNALEVDPGTGIEYLGGSFSYIGPNRSFGAALSFGTGDLDMDFPNVNNRVLAVIPDGQGGWYIGGKFTLVNGAMRNRMARINADGSLHPFNPNFSSLFTEVLAIAVRGDTVFAGGSFDFVNSQVRQNFVALNANTGGTLSMSFNTNDDVLALGVSGNTLYMGGRFNQVSGSTRNYCAAINIGAGNLAGWNPNANGTVKAVAIGGDGIYLGGTFTQVSGLPRPRIAKVNGGSGTPLAWDPFATGSCDALAFSGSSLFVAGAFTIIGGEFRNGLAELDESTGLATPWAPEFDGTVASLAYADGAVLIGGDLTAINGEPRWHMGAIDALTGETLDFGPVTNGGTIAAVGMQSGQVYAGGDFNSIGGVLRNNVAAIDISTGRATTWDPQADAEVYTLAKHGSDIYLGGAFTLLSGTSRIGIGAMDGSGALLAWAPQADAPVRTLVLASDTLYAGGEFLQMAGAARSRAAGFNLDDGSLLAWAPAVNNTVLAIEPHAALVYLGGDFTTINGDARNRVAATDASTGSTTSWDPSSPGTVRCISASGNAVYVGGSFSGTIGGQPRSGAAKIDAATGLATPWAPSILGSVYTIRASADSVLMSGTFTSVASTTRYGLAATNTTSGAALPFVLDAYFNGVFDHQSSPGYYHIGGDFTHVLDAPLAGGIAHENLASFITNSITAPVVAGSICPGVAFDVDLNVAGNFQPSNVFTLELSAPGGSFAAPVAIGSLAGSSGGTIIVTAPMETLADEGYRVRVRSSDPPQIGGGSNVFTVLPLLTWYADTDGDEQGDPGASVLACSAPNGTVANNFDCDDSDVLVYRYAPCNDGLPLTEGEIWNEQCICGGGDTPMTLMQNWPMTVGSVYTIAPDTASGVVYIGGSFSSIVHPEPYGALLNNSTGAANLACLNPNGIVWVNIADGSGGWYIGGDFTTVGGQPRAGLARLNADGSLHPFDPGVTGTVQALLLNGTTLYLGGAFTAVGGLARQNLAAVDVNTGTPTSWSPTANNLVEYFALSGSTIYVVGNFNQINGVARVQRAAISTSGTGALTGWYPTLSVPGSISAIAANSSTVFLGGNFTTVNGIARQNIVAVNLTTGATLAWNPGSTVAVRHLTLNGNTIYVVSSVGGTDLVARSTTGNGTWLWSASSQGDIWYASSNATQVLIAGPFTQINGQARAGCALLNASDGSLLAWNPMLNGGAVYSGAFSGGSIHIGGTFASLGGVPRQNLAAFDMSTGALRTWNPTVDHSVNSIVLGNGLVYAGGSFITANGQTRNRIAAFDPVTGALNGFNPNANNRVNSLAMGADGLYIGGNFTAIGGANRNYIAKLDPFTGGALAWNPNPPSNVTHLALGVEGLWVGGSFNPWNQSGASRRYLAAIGLQTPSFLTFNAGLFFSGLCSECINALALDDSTVYFGGSSNLLIHDRVTGAFAPWSSGFLYVNDAVRSLLRDGHTLYVGGDFTLMEDQPRVRIAGFNLFRREISDFDHSANFSVNALAASGHLLFVGGTFSEFDGEMRGGFAVLGKLDCNGMAGGTAWPGSTCDDGNSSTIEDVIQPDCSCAGELITTIPGAAPVGALRAYPNPTNGLLHLSRRVGGAIHDAQGRLLVTVTNTDQVDLSGLVSGMYQLRTTDGVVLKFIKH